jgi:hypothetical protein
MRMKETAMKVASATTDGRGGMVVVMRKDDKAENDEDSFPFRLHITASQMSYYRTYYRILWVSLATSTYNSISSPSLASYTSE